MMLGRSSAEIAELREHNRYQEQKLRELSKQNDYLHRLADARFERITELEGMVIVLREEKEAIWTLIEMELDEDGGDPQ